MNSLRPKQKIIGVEFMRSQDKKKSFQVEESYRCCSHKESTVLLSVQHTLSVKISLFTWLYLNIQLKKVLIMKYGKVTFKYKDSKH